MLRPGVRDLFNKNRNGEKDIFFPDCMYSACILLLTDVLFMGLYVTVT